MKIHDPNFIRTLLLEMNGCYIPRFELPLWSIEQRGASILLRQHFCSPYPTASGPANEWHEGIELVIRAHTKKRFSFRWTLSLCPATTNERCVAIVCAFVKKHNLELRKAG